MAVSTPWGASQHSTKILRGAVFHSTAGHGGVHISEQLAGKALSKFVRNNGINDGNGYWYEEDCGIALPMYELMKAGYADEICKAFNNLVADRLQASFFDSIARWYPEYLNDNHEKYAAIPCYEKLAKDWTVRLHDGRILKVAGHQNGDCIVMHGGQMLRMPKRVYFRNAENVLDKNDSVIWSGK